MQMKTFYKVIVLQCDVFMSSIIDERHFATRPEAEAYSNTFSGGGNYCNSYHVIRRSGVSGSTPHTSNKLKTLNFI